MVKKLLNMSQSLSTVYIHTIFGTKNRAPLISENIEKNLHAYMAGILKGLNSPALKINSMPDHIHILFRQSKNHSIAHILELLKKDSSKWMKTQNVIDFKWQGGYAAYSVSQSKVEHTIKYIENQKIHHKKMTFEQEIEKFMIQYQVTQYSKDFFWE